jgi:hypothetical protein
METKFILVNSLQEQLILSLFDYNEHRKDTPLGTAAFEMNKLLEDATQEGIQLPILKDGKDRGHIRLNASYYPVLKPEVVGGKEQLPNTSLYKLHYSNTSLNPFIRRRYRASDIPSSQRAGRLKVARWGSQPVCEGVPRRQRYRHSQIANHQTHEQSRLGVSHRVSMRG